MHKVFLCVAPAATAEILPAPDLHVNRQNYAFASQHQSVRTLCDNSLMFSNGATTRESILAVARTHPDVLAEPSPEVIFTEFGDSTLNFELRVWTVQQVQTPSRLKSDLYFAIFEAFRKENIELPFPQRDLHIRSVSEKVSSSLTCALIEREGTSPTSSEQNIGGDETQK